MSEIILYGVVGEDLFGTEYFTAREVRSQLKGRTGPLTVRLNSGGGIATEGQAIYHILKDHPGPVTVEIEGVAASAASLIAMAGDRIVMRTGAWMLVHDPAAALTNGRGTAADHEAVAGMLEKVTEGYAAIYAARSGRPVAEVREIMRAETVYTGPEAVAAGFADEVEDVAAVAAAPFAYAMYRNAPAELRAAGVGRLCPSTRKQKAVAAAIAGLPAPSREDIMLDHETAGAGPAEAAEAATTQPKMSAAQHNRLAAVAARTGVPAAEVDRIAASAPSFEAALDALNAVWAKLGDTDAPMLGPSEAERTAYLSQSPVATVGADWTGGRALANKMADALAALTAPQFGLNHEPTMGREFMAESVEATKLRMAHHSALASGQRGVSDREAWRIWMAGTVSTSDFSTVAAGGMEILVARSLEQAPIGLRECVHVIPVSDWHDHKHHSLSGANIMQTVTEAGEPKFLTIDERGELLEAPVRKAGFYRATEELIRNSASTLALEVAFARSFIESANETLRSVIATKVATPGTLVDGVDVFHASRGNEAAAAAPITVAALAAARTGLERAVDSQGTRRPVEPGILLVAPEQRTAAEQIVAEIAAAEVGEVNPFTGRLRVISDPGLSGAAGAHWFVLGAPSRFDGLALILMDDQPAPRIQAQPSWTSFGMEWRASWPMGCSWVRPSWFRMEIPGT